MNQKSQAKTIIRVALFIHYNSTTMCTTVYTFPYTARHGSEIGEEGIHMQMSSNDNVRIDSAM